MQTFLPYDFFIKSHSCLDKKRQWKQTVEASQILNTLTGKSNGWKNHPAVLMWKGYEEALEVYFHTSLFESISRGIKVKKYQLNQDKLDQTKVLLPNWLGDKDFHNSHRSNLLRKDEAFYSKYGWDVPNSLAYIWPKP